MKAMAPNTKAPSAAVTPKTHRTRDVANKLAVVRNDVSQPDA
jgi:hypothetical protein